MDINPTTIQEDLIKLTSLFDIIQDHILLPPREEGSEESQLLEIIPMLNVGRSCVDDLKEKAACFNGQSQKEAV